MTTALFHSGWGPLAVGVGVGALMLVATLVALSRPRGAWLRSRLDPYGRIDGAGAATAALDTSPGWRPSTERLVGATEQRLEDTRVWRATMRLLERAGSQTRPASFLYVMLLAGAGVLVLALIVGASFGGALLLGLAALALPWFWLRLQGHRRVRLFEQQLPDVLMAMSSSLKVGLTFTHAMAAVVEEGNPPVSEEFDRVLRETELGRPFDDALASMAERIDSDDLRFVLLSVVIQREVGGSLANLFLTVSETVRERQHFRLKVRALTAMGRMSAYILVALPFVTAGALSLVSPGYLTPLFSTSAGRVLIVIALLSMTIGGLVLKKIVSVKG